MISVIIPAHNEEEYILQTIASVKKQSWKEKEIIVVCDGCTDRTFDIVKKEVEKVAIVRRRGGPAIAKNEGAKLAKGDILVFLDADTLMSPTLLENIARVTKDGVVGTARIRPSNRQRRHRMMMWLKNNVLCPFGVTNGIIFCTAKTFQERGEFDHKLQKMEDGKFVRDRSKKAKFIMLDDYVVSSMRRFDQLGYVRVMGYWLREYLKPSGKAYGVIR